MKKKLFVSVTFAVIAMLSLTLGAFAQGPQPGRGFGTGTGYALPPATGGTLDAQTTQALIDALNDEYHAHAFYEAVIAKFGQVAPFTNILRAEQLHIETVKLLLTRYNVAIPADAYTGKVTAPATLKEALQAAVDAEKANVALYDRLLASVTQADIKTAFEQMRLVSQTRHLPAFEQALTGNYATGTGQGFGGGRWNNSTAPTTTQTNPLQQFFGGRWNR